MFKALYFCILFFYFFSSFPLFSQKKVIDHTVYNSWNSIKNQKISYDGNLISFEINPHKGDGSLHVLNVNSGKEVIFHKGKQAHISKNEKLVAFLIPPGYDTLRRLELDKVKKDKWVKDSLGIYWTESDSLVKIANVNQFAFPKNGDFIAYTVLKDSLKIPDNKKKKPKKSKKQVEKCESDGNQLYIIDANSKTTKVFPQVSQFSFNDDGTSLAFISHFKKGKIDQYRIHLYDTYSGEHFQYDTIFHKIEQLTFSKKGHKFAFMASKDTAKETRLYEVYTWQKNEAPTKIIDNAFSDIPKELTPSPKASLSFSLDENRLYLGIYPKPEKKEKDTLLDSEKAELDIWHYKDKRLQPQQLKMLQKDKDKSYLSMYDLSKNRLVQLEDDTLTVQLLDQGNGNFALGSSKEQYQGTYNWSMPWPQDYYRVNVETGAVELIKENVGHSIGISPNGNHFIFFKSEENQIYSIEINSKVEQCLTCSDSINWKKDINGMPYPAEPIGSLGYLDENTLLIYSEFDIWKYDFQQEKLSLLTNPKGEDQNIEYKILRLDSGDSTYINLNNTLILGVNQNSFDESIYRFDMETGNLIELYTTNHKLLNITKSEKGDKFIFRQMNVKEYPNLFLTTVNFDSPQQISNANPQQAEYIWPTVEQVEWKSYNGETLRGLLYKPDNFDSSKSYPLLIYYYELYSDRIHSHYIPKPTASIIFPTEYTSAGYVVFIPDIRYTPGYPGKSAYNSIMSGTDKILELYPNIDSTRMGLQGQSWGGYQTTQLITLTNRYAAAMAGAPVSNMFSAYGGIRWATGLNRQFQYEHTQSRIGGTIWEVPELYVENSPLFKIPDVETPLLIMHNDNDGAVPWYQGIELFTAMKRLGKQVWMLQYNNEEHNLMKDKNRQDLSIRMRQFFDHFLQGKPAPEWLEKGIPAVEKGKNYGLE